VQNPATMKILVPNIDILQGDIYGVSPAPYSDSRAPVRTDTSDPTK
jgi:translation initiation factor IF-1